MAPKPRKSLEPKVSDYLAERRAARNDGDRSLFSFRQKSEWKWCDHHENPNLSKQEKAEKIKWASKKIEEEVRRKEFLLADMDTTYSKDPIRSGMINSKVLDAADHVNDLIIDSIKAKIALIESS